MDCYGVVRIHSGLHRSGIMPADCRIRSRPCLGRGAALWALWLAALCPFTADYTAVPLTETNSIFCVALGIFSSGRVIAQIRSTGRLPWKWLVLTSLALSCAILFRPDGVLLSAAVLPGIWWYARPRHSLDRSLARSPRISRQGSLDRADLCIPGRTSFRSVDHPQLPRVSCFSAIGATLRKRSGRRSSAGLRALDQDLVG